MAGEFLRRKSRTRSPLACSACASGPRSSEAKLPSLASGAREPPWWCEFHLSGPRSFTVPIMRILIADDHAVVRHGLKQILADEFKRAEFGEARNGQEALNRVWKEKWDVVILDITMPGRGGLEILKEIKKA